MPSPRLFFFSSLGLMVTDGTTAGTYLVEAQSAGFIPEGDLAPLGDDVLFAAASAATPGTTTLWSSNDTTAGTTPILALPNRGVPGYSGTSADSFDTAGDRVVFAYSDGSEPAYDTRIWSTDGTAADTSVLGGTAYPGGGAPTANGTVFLADGLYVTDGTVGGERLLKADIPCPVTGLPAEGFASVQGIAGLAGHAVFGATKAGFDSGSRDLNQLWVTDGTTAGTQLVTRLPDRSLLGGSEAPISQMVTFGGRVLFSYNDGSGTDLNDLWVTDGTAAGTVELPSTADPTIGPGKATIAGGRYVFASRALGLVVTDGTPGGTAVIQPRVEGAGGFAPIPSMASLGGEAVFAASSDAGPHGDGTPNEIWITDGTAAGTKPIITLPGTIGDFSTPMAALGNEVLFDYSDGSASYQL